MAPHLSAQEMDFLRGLLGKGLSPVRGSGRGRWRGRWRGGWRGRRQEPGGEEAGGNGGWIHICVDYTYITTILQLYYNYITTYITTYITSAFPRNMCAMRAIKQFVIII